MAKLYFYYSAMNAGKTTTLLQSSYNYKERGMETILFIPKVDQRYGLGNITSRIGLSQKACAFGKEFLFSPYIKELKEKTPNLACVLIDEAQFLTKDQVIELTHITTELNIPVLTYGLRTDFMGETFEGSHYLLAWAQELIEIKTICHCGRKATMNARVDENGKMIKSGAQVEIGGNERYISLCMKHFLKEETS
ncbi:MAG TPA: thymidine kinase [Alphaproteobacteria bacterium]|nr:thymidine kinase [Alphaproteobacteria bacterium]